MAAVPIEQQQVSRAARSGGRLPWPRVRMLVSPEGQVLFSDLPAAELGFVDGFQLTSEHVLNLLRWVHSGYLSACSVVTIPECDRWLEITVRPSAVADIYVLQAVARAA